MFVFYNISILMNVVMTKFNKINAILSDLK